MIPLVTGRNRSMWVQKGKLLRTSESAKSRTAGCLPDCSKTKRHADACLFFNRNPVPISYPRSSRNFSISADESVTPFSIFVRSWFQMRMSYFGSPPFQDTMLTSFFQPLLVSESTPILLMISNFKILCFHLGNSITEMKAGRFFDRYPFPRGFSAPIAQFPQ